MNWFWVRVGAAVTSQARSRLNVLNESNKTNHSNIVISPPIVQFGIKTFWQLERAKSFCIQNNGALTGSAFTAVNGKRFIQKPFPSVIELKSSPTNESTFGKHIHRNDSIFDVPTSQKKLKRTKMFSRELGSHTGQFCSLHLMFDQTFFPSNCLPRFSIIHGRSKAEGDLKLNRL